MLAAERHVRIVEHLERCERLSVDQLAAYVPTSAATIRRDLTHLAEAGLLQRVHGGAITVTRLRESLPPNAEDEALAAAVYARFSNGDAVILEGRRVIPIVARMLAAEPMRLIVVTNQLDVARTLVSKRGIDVILLGGKVHPAGYTLPQPLGASDLKFLVANKAFVEVEGVHGGAGFTTAGVDDARFKHDLLQHALHKTVIAPAGCLGLLFAHRIAQVSEIDSWITTQLEDSQRETAIALRCEILESGR